MTNNYIIIPALEIDIKTFNLKSTDVIELRRIWDKIGCKSVLMEDCKILLEGKWLKNG